jgi:DMSO reductase anchor subunit
MGEFLSWDGWNTITIVACAVGLVACVSFAAAYQYEVGWDWTRNPMGRYLMTRKLLLGGLFVTILLNRFIPGWSGRLAVTALLMSLFAVQTFVPYRLLKKVQKPDHANEEAQRR